MDSRLERSSRRTFLIGAGVSGIGALAGCGGSQSAAPTSTTRASTTSSGESSSTTSGPTTLRLAIPSTDSFDPIKIKGDGSTEITQQLYSTLTHLPNGSLEPKLLLAKDYEVSKGGARYTFDLREDVTFHDGTPLTADDFVYSWERLAASEHGQESKVILNGAFQLDHETKTVTRDGEETEVYEPGSLGVKAVDDHTLQVDLKKPFFQALYEFSYGALAPIPEGIVGDIDEYDGEMDYERFAQKNPVGTGPFQFESISPGTEAVVSAFDDYVGPRGNVERIHYQVLDSSSARYHYAVNRNDDLFTLPLSKYSQEKVSLTETGEYGQQQGTYGPLKNGETVNYGTYPTNYTAYFIFNCNSVPRYVRRAINYVANQELFVDQAFDGLGQPCYHYSPPSVFPGGADAYEAHAKSGKHNQTEWGADGFPYGYGESKRDAARQLMEENGHGQSNPYSLTLTTYTDRKPASYKRIGQILQSQLQAVHVDLALDQKPFSAVIDGAINNRLDFFSLGNGLAYPSALDTLKFVYPNSSNFTRWGATDGKGEQTEASKAALDAWDKIQNNLGRTDAEQRARDEAIIEMEEAAWHGAPSLLNYHPVSQQYWYDSVETDVKTSSFHEYQYDTLSLSR